MLRAATLGALTLALYGAGLVALAPAAAQPEEALEEPRAEGDVASAEETTEEARALFDEGLALADRREWERAVQRFRAALERRESPAVRLNLAISLARMGRLVEALEELERVHADPETDDAVRAEAELLRAETAPRLGRLRIEVVGEPGEARVTVDGRPWPELGVYAAADPGVRVVRLVEGDVELDVEEADVPEGGDSEVTLELPIAPAEPTVDDSWIWGTVIGAAIVTVGAAVVTGVAVAEL